MPVELLDTKNINVLDLVIDKPVEVSIFDIDREIDDEYFDKLLYPLLEYNSTSEKSYHLGQFLLLREVFPNKIKNTTLNSKSEGVLENIEYVTHTSPGIESSEVINRKLEAAAVVISLFPECRRELQLENLKDKALMVNRSFKENENWLDYLTETPNFIVCFPEERETLTKLSDKQMKDFLEFIKRREEPDYWTDMQYIKILHPELLPNLEPAIRKVQEILKRKVYPEDTNDLEDFFDIAERLYELRVLQSESVVLTEYGWHIVIRKKDNEQEKPIPERRKY